MKKIRNSIIVLLLIIYGIASLYFWLEPQLQPEIHQVEMNEAVELIQSGQVETLLSYEESAAMILSDNNRVMFSRPTGEIYIQLLDLGISPETLENVTLRYDYSSLAEYDKNYSQLSFVLFTQLMLFISWVAVSLMAILESRGRNLPQIEFILWLFIIVSMPIVGALLFWLFARDLSTLSTRQEGYSSST